LPTLRIIFATLLLAAPMLGAQQAGNGVKADAGAALHPAPVRSDATAGKGRASLREPLQITICFKRIFHGKLASDKTYTLVASPNGTMPQIRDDSRFRTDLNDPNRYLESNTDIDILEIRRLAASAYVALRISTQTIGSDIPEGFPKLPGVGLHKYLLTPTVPMGKQIAVYASDDLRNNTRVEVQLLVQPFVAQ
jgi:hypothetical protein